MLSLDTFLSQPFSTVQHNNSETGHTSWFLGGQLNVSENCVDRHAIARPNQAALIWEMDDGHSITVTFQQLLENVCRVANVLTSQGVKKGDRVCIYMPMTPHAVYAMLACARIGAPHSVVFAGFSVSALASRINNAKCSVVITADQGLRGGKIVPLKATVDQALKECPSVKTVLVHRRTGTRIFHILVYYASTLPCIYGMLIRVVDIHILLVRNRRCRSSDGSWSGYLSGRCNARFLKSQQFFLRANRT